MIEFEIKILIFLLIGTLVFMILKMRKYKKEITELNDVEKKQQEQISRLEGKNNE